MMLEDIEDLGNKLLIKVPYNKTNKPRSFIVNEKYLEIYRRYAANRPKNFDNSRFFYKYQNGKSYRQVIGVHQFGKMPQIVADYLNLPNAKEYTGHCFRRSSATLLVDAGADLMALKRHGGWSSDKVAESYIDESIANKNEVADKIFNMNTEHETGHQLPKRSGVTTNSEHQPLRRSDVLGLRDVISDSLLSEFFPFGNFVTDKPLPQSMFNNPTNCTINVNIVNNYNNK